MALLLVVFDERFLLRDRERHVDVLSERVRLARASRRLLPGHARRHADVGIHAQGARHSHGARGGLEPRARLPVRLGASQRLRRVQAAQQGLSERCQGIHRGAHPQRTGRRSSTGTGSRPSTPELRVTICWNDPAGTPPSPSLDPAHADARERSRPARGQGRRPRTIRGGSIAHNPVERRDEDRQQRRQRRAGRGRRRRRRASTRSGSRTRGRSRRVRRRCRSSSRAPRRTTCGTCTRTARETRRRSRPPCRPRSTAIRSTCIRARINEAGISVAKALVITGVDGAALTTVDGNGSRRGMLHLPVGEQGHQARGTSRSRTAPRRILGGGIYCSNSSVTDRALRHRELHSPWYGGGIAVINASRRSGTARSFRIRPITTAAACTSRRRARSSIRACSTTTSPPAPAAGIAHDQLDASVPQLHRSSTIRAGTNGGGIYVGTERQSDAHEMPRHLRRGGRGNLRRHDRHRRDHHVLRRLRQHRRRITAASITDQTGIDDNISPIPCSATPGASPPDLTISSLSPCAPALEPVRAAHRRARRRMRRRGPISSIASVEFSDMQPAFGDSVRATVKVKNIGAARRDESFYVDYYNDARHASAAGDAGGPAALRRRPRGGGFRSSG